MTESQANMTRGFAKGLGLFLILFGIGVAVQARYIWVIVPNFFEDEALVFVTAAFGLAIGCAMVAAHHHRNSLAAIIITLFGWVTTIRSAVLLTVPHVISGYAFIASREPLLPFIPAFLAVLIGVYLTYVGWFSRRSTKP